MYPNIIVLSNYSSTKYKNTFIHLSPPKSLESPIKLESNQFQELLWTTLVNDNLNSIHLISLLTLVSV